MDRLEVTKKGFAWDQLEVKYEAWLDIVTLTAWLESQM